MIDTGIQRDIVRPVLLAAGIRRLAGAAVGNFVASTMYRAFTGVSGSHRVSVGMAPTGGGVVLTLAAPLR